MIFSSISIYRNLLAINYYYKKTNTHMDKNKIMFHIHNAIAST